MVDFRDEVLVLVSVAPMDPYPELLRSGPQATWMQEHVEGIQIVVFSASSLGRLRRQLADLREMLRFPLALPAEVGTVDSRSKLMKAYTRLVSQTRLERDTSDSYPEFTKTLAFKGILAAAVVVQTWERHVGSYLKNRRRATVSRSGRRLIVDRPSTTRNSMAIQQDLISALIRGPQFRGVLFVTASAYVDQRRLLAWVDKKGSESVVGGAHALARNGSTDAFISGFCQYFSWDILQRIACATDFDHSLPNDGALTKWLVAHGIPWEDLGIEWFTDDLAQGVCPLCADETICVVRCTSHGSRWREAEFMRKLHHWHVHT